MRQASSALPSIVRLIGGSTPVPVFVPLFAGILWADALQAHERWILTPEQIAEWHAKPLPGLYTDFSVRNVTMIAAFARFTAGWKGAPETEGGPVAGEGAV